MSNSPKYRVGCVPYVNARPLVHFLPPSVEVVYDVPSRLPALLDSGEVQAILVSSIESLKRPKARFAAGVCIGSDGPAESVRLFSKEPMNEIRTLTLDPSSLTSNMLALVLLDALYGVQPIVLAEKADAQLFIGDRGMTEQAGDRIVLDLGLAWKSWTGLPFVWALWVGDVDFPIELSALLGDAAKEGSKQNHVVAKAAAAQANWDPLRCHRYLTESMRFSLGERELAGFERFRDELVLRGIIEFTEMPLAVTVERISA